MSIEFVGFPKIARLSREIIVTEKIDGTNAQIFVWGDGSVLAGSRTRWITPDDDNYGFARWAEDHASELRQLGPGRHYGEWFGQGIQRSYGLKEKRFSLFNVVRWCLHSEEPKTYPTADPRITKTQERLPTCCGLVPVLYRGEFDMLAVQSRLDWLQERGSIAAPGFMRPEGVVVYHTAAGVSFKKTLERDADHKTVKV